MQFLYHGDDDSGVDFRVMTPRSDVVSLNGVITRRSTSEVRIITRNAFCKGVL
jgi:hypothetical protein